MPAEHGKPGLTQGHALLQAADELALLEQQVQERRAAVEAKQRAARLRAEAKAAKAHAAKKSAFEAELAALALQEQDLDVDLQSNTSLSATLSAAPGTPLAPDTVRITSSVVPCSLCNVIDVHLQHEQQCAFGHRHCCQDAYRLLCATRASSICRCILIRRGPLSGHLSKHGLVCRALCRLAVVCESCWRCCARRRSGTYG